MSSQFNPSTGSAKAVDGGKNPTYAGRQCALSKGGQTALWRVDLGNLSSIHHIKIYPRTDNLPWDETNGHLRRLLGFSVYVSNTTDKEDGSICFYDNEFYTPSTIPEIPTINCTMPGIYVIFYNERKQGQPSYYDPEAFVELCEFEVYGCLRNAYGGNCSGTCPVNCLNDICDIISGTCFFCDTGFKGPRCENECDGGKYGPGCSLTCGACINNTQCHHINGSCPQGCGPGYKGQQCDKECDGGKYGPGCSLTCGACINNTQCHHINGSCLQGCGPGYKGVKCEKECDGGKYGPGCSLTCGACINNTLCHHINGSCLQGCSPGYKGQKCDEECNLGTYGKDCQHRCGSCINQTHCHYVNGTCFEGCGPGYLGNKCVDECPTGKFGNNCNNTCSANCKDNLKKCDVTSGDCEGGCLDGWHGKHCNRKCDNGTYGKDCTNKCGNCQQQPCHHTNGTCLSGCSSSSYKGETCKEEIKNPTNIVAIVGGVLGTIFCGGIILIIGLIYRRWRSGDRASNSDRPLVYIKPSANQGFTSLPEEDTKSTLHRFDNQLNSSVKDFGDVYENEEHTPDISIDQIKQAIDEKSKDKNAGFIKEYSLLPYGEKYPCSVGKRPENVTKNRFKTTFPYDHSRVVLKVDDAIPSDYINANYIDGPKMEQEYIASQGPKQNSVNDFWGMIWQTNTTQIVMLTNLVEGTKVKCAKYWPDRGVEKECRNLTIKLEKETHYAFYEVRRFKVFHKKANTSRTLTQHHYTSWPDHGTPEPLFLVIFHHHVIASRSPEDTSPTIVHCSAGIGRTGTYIALDALSKAGKMTGKINVTEYVKSMRTDRMNMVQTHEQYKTIFQALHDVFRAPIQFFKISDFVKKVENMSKEEPANWTVIRKEFQQLLAILPVYQQEDYKLAKQNKPPTCSDKILPLDKFNLNLTPLPDHRSCFINAIFLSSYTKENAFIVTQYPENAVDFLRLLNDHESNYVILLDPSDEIEKVDTWLPSTPKPEIISPFTFRFQSVSNTDLKLRTFLVDQNEQDTKTIVVVEPNKSLKLESGKQDTSSVRALVNYTLGVSPENTITIVSKDGAELCGMFCAIHNCMQQLHMDGNIDVFSTVRQLQICRPEFCSSQDEYSLIYKAIKDQIQSENENLYSNM
uniref:protein-tyrosine-phosphatase n=1 Tax=Magallana gigas TaxID=29159 RepID=A0A8W8M3E8_MAGGI